MSDNGIGFGGFLLGLGVGWYLFRFMDFSIDLFAYTLIIMGAGMVINALLGRGRVRSPVKGLFGGIVGGLFLALFLTQGFGVIGEIFSGLGNFSASDYRATETEILSGDVNLEVVYLEIDNRNGGITVETWDRAGYRIDLTYRAKGFTKSQAEKRLQDIVVLFSDVSEGDRQILELGFQVSGGKWSDLAVSVDVKLPRNVELELDLDTSNGEVNIEDLVAKRIIFKTSNGAVSLVEVYAETLRGSTSNGRISGQVEGVSVELETGNGGIYLALPCRVTGSYDLSTGNGSIDLSVSTSGNVGYRVELTNSLGDIEVNLGDLVYSVNDKRRKVAETEGFDSREVRIILVAATSIGGIEVN